jgi:hypothetical protein
MTNSVHDDGELAEIQTVGIEGSEKNCCWRLSKCTGAITAIHANTSRTSSLLEHGWTPCTTIEVTTPDADTRELDEGGQAIGEGPVPVQINGAEF